MKRSLFIFIISFAVIGAQHASAATFIVNSNADGQDVLIGDGICDDGSGNCTLRAAIGESNGLVGSDTIQFSAPMTITPTSNYGDIVDPVTIDASLGSGGTTCGAGGVSDTVIGVEVDGSQNVTGNGFVFAGGSAGSKLRGLNVHDFMNGSVEIHATNSVSIECNFIGTNKLGTTAASNVSVDGIKISEANHITIGGTVLGDGNLISGNKNTDADINPGAIRIVNGDQVNIWGNIIGPDRVGTTLIGNDNGISVIDDSDDLVIGGNTVSNPALRNIISGNILDSLNGSAIQINTGSDNITIQGNWIGLDSTGIAPMGNGGIGNTGGIDVCNENGCGGDENQTTGLLIGGPNLGDGNILAAGSAQDNFGIVVAGPITDVTIQGNWIGLGSDGIYHTGLEYNNGLRITGNNLNTKVGGTGTNDANIVGKVLVTGFAIYAGGGSDISVWGNYFGYVSDKITKISASMNIGIAGGILSQGSGVVKFGGGTPDKGNHIANTQYGILALDAGINSDPTLYVANNIITGSSIAGIGVELTRFFTQTPTLTHPIVISQNSLLGNAFGIDLVEDTDGDVQPDAGIGEDANDSGDTDIGANLKINHPVIITVNSNGNVDYELDVPVTGYPYRVEFFKNPSGANSSGYGEGEVYLDYDEQTVSSAGLHAFTKNLPGITNADIITATVTACADAMCNVFYGTSEFSNNVPIGITVTAPVVTSSGQGAPFAPHAVSLPTDKPTSTPKISLDGFKPLKKGVKNAAVKQLQVVLNANGAQLSPDGVFGKGTEKAVKAYQSKNGLKADGIVGLKTVSILNR